MITQKIDDISFRLNEACDFSFLAKYGKVFCVFDETGSGCISFGVDSGQSKYFVKIAGAKTIQPYVGVNESVEMLKNSIHIYQELQHPHLIELLEHYQFENLYIAVFRWAKGDCLFDHWNFKKYKQQPKLQSPALRFKQLAIEKKLLSFDIIFNFLITTAAKNYVAIDFYDGSILYDFSSDTTTICDIDFFRHKPTINNIGEDFWGTKRLKAPEEYRYGDTIDEVTNVFTMGALIFHFFGNYSDHQIKQMYTKNEFIPCPLENWSLSQSLYEATLTAVNQDRSMRYPSIADFYEIWIKLNHN